MDTAPNIAKTLAIIHIPVFGTFVKAYNNGDFVHRGGSQYIIELQSELIKCTTLSAAANNPDTVKTLKNVFDAFRIAAKTYAQVK